MSEKPICKGKTWDGYEGAGMELTTSQAVRTYEVHPDVLNRLILMGRISARKNAEGRWLISKESLEQWNAWRVRRVRRVVLATETQISATAADRQEKLKKYAEEKKVQEFREHAAKHYDALLAACKALRDRIEALQGTDEYGIEDKEAWEKGCAAIAAAEAKE